MEDNLKSETAMLTKCQVFKGEVKIGYGYVVYRSLGRMRMILQTNEGMELPENNFYSIKMEDSHLVILNRTIQ